MSNPEFIDPQENAVVPELPYFDAVAVLGGRIMQQSECYVPADYTQADEYGITGGIVRVDAAASMFLMGAADKHSDILFSGGVTPPTNGELPYAEIPTEAAVYRETFLKRLREVPSEAEDYADLLFAPPPECLEETESTTTLSGLTKVLSIARERNWSRAALITNHFHVDRVNAFLDHLAPSGSPLQVESAESWKTAGFGRINGRRFTEEARDKYYPFTVQQVDMQPPMNLRVSSEWRGIRDWNNSTYISAAK